MGRFHERHPDDFYKTPPECTRALLAHEEFWYPHDCVADIHEPACGDGAISEVLHEAGYITCSTDLVDRNYGTAPVDFLKTTKACAYSLVTNPPFKLADEFVIHAHRLGYHKIALLLRTAFLEGEARRKRLFVDYPPIRILQFSARQTLWKGDDPDSRSTGGMAAYAWFIWENGFKGNPTIKWIARDDGKAAGAPDLADRGRVSRDRPVAALV